MSRSRSRSRSRDYGGLVVSIAGLMLAGMSLGLCVADAIQRAGGETVPAAWMEELRACQAKQGDRCYLEYDGKTWELLVAPEGD